MTFRSIRNERGGALMLVLVTVVILGLGAGMAGSSWKTIVQQEREAELLWRGDQIRRAIESYMMQGAQHQTPTPGAKPPAPKRLYPGSLEELVKDPHSPGTVRYLRKVYKDPMTGEDWVLIKDAGGRIKGVRSSSALEPFKKDGFSVEYESFKDAQSYAEWEFVFEPGRTGSRDTTRPGEIRGLPDRPASPDRPNLRPTPSPIPGR